MSPRRSLVFLVALVVVASVAATAHGLYAVAVTSGVPWRVALLYPVITDGLALVAYWATKQLDSARYPWVVIVVAAGLSGLAQAVNLAGLGESPMWLRFGVGYWPAIGALLAAHLLWLVWRPRSAEVAVPYAGGSGPLEPESDPSAPPSSVGDLLPVVAASPGNGSSNGHGTTKTAKAVEAVITFKAEHGYRPSRDRLAELVGCSTGTAQKALALTRKD